MTDPRTMPGQPSPEEMRAILEQLREVDPAVLVAEAFNMLAQGAQVKLGRPDARVLIDALAGMVTAAEPALPEELSTQMQQAIAQLQMTQVQAERDAAGRPEAPSDDAPGDPPQADGD
ncbi:MAG TPA: hypothetical protein VM307_15090, partial [Egibacteraceae bacterium]|nr:hypothetical protein [Egibacteraceae bacterium]